MRSVDECVQCCLNLFEKLPKSGKPTENEWTVLSCVLQYDNSLDKLEVVSLGTGSKCIGASKMSPKGDVLNDSHAEVIARRGLLLYLYDNIDKVLENTSSIFVKEGTRFKLKDNIEFVFYSSQLPCGDASIFPKSEEEHYGDILLSKKRKAIDDESEIDEKRSTFSDIHRTGAKCLPQNVQDCRESGVKYHLLGQVRTKPGRGDRTLSVSCSDKMAKWIYMGIQGRLLDMLLVEPIFINTFIFGGGVPYSEESLTRALLKRDKQSIIAQFVPKFVQTSVVFLHTKSDRTVRPAAGSIIWTKANDGLSEVAVQGRRQGVTKKKAMLLSSSLSISKYNLYRKFQKILHKNEELQQSIADEILDIPYNTMKAKSVKYEQKWLYVKSNFFKTWTIKPDIWNFKVNVT